MSADGDMLLVWLIMAIVLALALLLFYLRDLKPKTPARRQVEPCPPRGLEFTRHGDLEYSDSEPGAIVKFQHAAGPPHCPRGLVWSELEREKKKIALLRIVQ